MFFDVYITGGGLIKKAMKLEEFTAWAGDAARLYTLVPVEVTPIVKALQ